MKPSSSTSSKRRKDAVSSDEEIDISSALAGPGNLKKPKLSQKRTEEDEEDEDLESFIREATKKRDIKDGTKLLKKTKGRTKLVKGEVGGGSFQSMGMAITILYVMKTLL